MHLLEKCALILPTGDISGNSDSAARRYFGAHVLPERSGQPPQERNTEVCRADGKPVCVTLEICMHAIYIPPFLHAG